jgi:hypothetical protein
MIPLLRRLGSVAASRWPIGVIALPGTLAIAPASTERVQGRVPGADAPIAIE